ncbi:hypothetical protein, partial [Pelomonas sp. Root1444]|uniref:hypothetical protein n=1 Tax=Pelomonas sp. Root1444 TaxID=1736464 RepID=UPI001F285F27
DDAMSGARKRPAVLWADATRFALAAVPVTSTTNRSFTPVNARLHAVLTRTAQCSVAGATPRWMLRGARVARATLHWFSSREHGVQPRVRRPAVAMSDAGDKDSSESEAGRVWAQGRRLFSRAADSGVGMVCGSGPLLW